MTIPRLTGPLSNWIANAAPGERIIAQTHIHGQNDEVREAVAAQLVTVNQKRSEDGRRFDLIVTRISGNRPREKAPLSASGIGWIATRDKSLLPARVKQATALRKAGKAQPEIAKEMGLASRTIGKYLQMAREAGELE